MDLHETPYVTIELYANDKVQQQQAIDQLREVYNIDGNLSPVDAVLELAGKVEEGYPYIKREVVYPESSQDEEGMELAPDTISLAVYPFAGEGAEEQVHALEKELRTSQAHTFSLYWYLDKNGQPKSRYSRSDWDTENRECGNAFPTWMDAVAALPWFYFYEVAQKPHMDNEPKANEKVLFKEKEIMHRFTENELKEVSGKLASTNIELDEARAAARASAQEHKQRTESLQSKVLTLSNKVHSREELRNIQVVEILNFDTGKKETWDLDKAEKLEETQLTYSERQTTFH